MGACIKSQSILRRSLPKHTFKPCEVLVLAVNLAAQNLCHGSHLLDGALVPGNDAGLPLDFHQIAQQRSDQQKHILLRQQCLRQHIWKKRPTHATQTCYLLLTLGPRHWSLSASHAHAESPIPLHQYRKSIATSKCSCSSICLPSYLRLPYSQGCGNLDKLKQQVLMRFGLCERKYLIVAKGLQLACKRRQQMLVFKQHSR